MTSDVLSDDGEFKDNPPVANRPWIRFCVDMLEHDIVGLPKDEPWNRHNVWEWMLCEAARLDRKRVIQGKTVYLGRGQLAFSLRFLSRKAMWSVAKLRRYLATLRRHGMIEATGASGTQGNLFSGELHLSDASPKGGTGITIVTVSNYRKFQDVQKKRPAQDRHTSGTGPAQSNTQYTGQRDLHQSTEGVNGKKEDTRENESPSGIDGAPGERLPFTADVIRRWAQVDGVDVQALIDRYCKRIGKGAVIRDPDSYLNTMCEKAAAKHLKVTVEQVRQILSRNTRERVTATANVVGAFSRPSQVVIDRARRYNAPRADAALAAMAGKSFNTQVKADRAFEGEITAIRFGTERTRRFA